LPLLDLEHEEPALFAPTPWDNFPSLPDHFATPSPLVHRPFVTHVFIIVRSENGFGERNWRALQGLDETVQFIGAQTDCGNGHAEAGDEKIVRCQNRNGARNLRDRYGLSLRRNQWQSSEDSIQLPLLCGETHDVASPFATQKGCAHSVTPIL
jgi:hypothetical protein